MALLQPTDIVNEVSDVLAKAAKGKGAEPHFLTAYQILGRLHKDLRKVLIVERKRGGRGGGKKFAAPSVVSKAAVLAGAEVVYLDTKGLEVKTKDGVICPGNSVCALYRLR